MEEAKNQPTTIDEILQQLQYGTMMSDNQEPQLTNNRQIAKDTIDAYYRDQFKQMIERAKADVVVDREYRSEFDALGNEAKQAILADLLALPELQEPPKHWSTDKDTKELMDASVADYHEDIRQALTDYFEGEV